MINFVVRRLLTSWLITTRFQLCHIGVGPTSDEYAPGTRGRHNWIGSVGSEKSIRSNFSEKATDPIQNFREGYRSDPKFSRRPPIRSNFFKNRSDRMNFYWFELRFENFWIIENLNGKSKYTVNFKLLANLF